MEPAISKRFLVSFVICPIARKEAGSTYSQLTWFTIRHIIVVRIDEPDFTEVVLFFRKNAGSFADGHQICRRRRSARFRGSECVEIWCVKEGSDFLEHRLWYQIGHGPDKANRFRFGIQAFQVANEILNHTRNNRQVMNRVGFYHIDYLFSLVPIQNYDLPPPE